MLKKKKMSTQSHHTAAGGGHHHNGTSEPMKSSSGHHQQQTNDGQQSQPNVRHIPIFVEGRDEPLVNKSNDYHKTSATNDGNESLYNNFHQQKQFHQQPQQHTRESSPKPPSVGGSLFDRVKNFPTVNLKNQASQQRRSDSPNRTIPVNVQHSTNNSNQQQPQQQQQSQPQPPQPQPPQQQQQRPNTAPVQSAAMRQSISSIQKIQNIQKDVLELMDHVEKFIGSSRKDKQYLYLDEMLTQNLLKLDTIDADGQENIKQARREAIKCINKCIAVLEAKADSGNLQEHQQQNENVPKNNETAGKNSSEKRDQNNLENSNK